MVVHERQHDDLVVLDENEERVREAAQDSSTDVTLYTLVQLWMSAKMRLGSLNVID